MVDVYRAPMWSRDDSVDRWAGVRRALRLGVCGVGGRLESTPRDAEHAVRAVDRLHGEQMARRLERFMAVSDGTQVWTVDEDGLFHRGELAGAWRFDDAEPAHAADLTHVRPCEWTERNVTAPQVPPAVLASFERGGRNFQQIRAAVS